MGIVAFLVFSTGPVNYEIRQHDAHRDKHKNKITLDPQHDMFLPRLFRQKTLDTTKRMMSQATGKCNEMKGA